MYYTQIRFTDWTKKQEMKEALKRNDINKAAEIARTAETTEYFDENGYKRFLLTILCYELVLLSLLIFIVVMIVLYIGRRI